MAWPQIIAVVIMTIGFLGNLLNSKSCSSLVTGFALQALWIFILIKGGFFS